MQRYHYKSEQHSHKPNSSFNGGLAIPKTKAQEGFAFLYELRPDVAPKAVRIPAKPLANNTGHLIERS